jgi:hypothetical protein
MTKGPIFKYELFEKTDGDLGRETMPRLYFPVIHSPLVIGTPDFSLY